MSKSLCLNADEFSMKVCEIKDALNESEYWIDDRLNVKHRDHGIFIFLKVVILPLARVFGCDPFRHIRIYNVAIALMQTYQNLEPGLDTSTKESVTLILGQLNKRASNRRSKRYLEVFKGQFTTPLVKAPPPPPSPRIAQFEAPTVQAPETPAREEIIEHQVIPQETPAVNTYQVFLKTHEQIMRITDEVLSQETEKLPEVEKDRLYTRILSYKQELRNVEGESWYPASRLQVMMLRNQLKLAFDTLAGYQEDIIGNTRRAFQASAREFWEKYYQDEDYSESDVEDEP